MKIALTDLHYLPSLEYFCALLPYKELIIERHAFYEKQSFHNRCYILGANKTERLIVPIAGKRLGTKISEVKIDHNQKWLSLHWKSICSAYGKAPFFEFYAQDFEEIFYKKHELLYQLNLDLLTLCLKILGIKPVLSESESYQPKIEDKKFFDLRGQISPKRPWQGRPFYRPKKYIQVFGNKFVENLSIVDLIFCQGTRALQLLKDSSPSN